MLLIYSDAITPRTEYIFELVFKHELGLQFTSTSDINLFRAYKNEKICYSVNPGDDCIYIQPTTLLFENTVNNVIVKVENDHGIPVLFPNKSELGFDIFASIFYMVTRYEEYFDHVADEHGRFKAYDSIAFKNNFLQQPVVNIWIKKLRELLLQKFPGIVLQQNNYKAIITYDIDIAYAFKGRGLIRTLGSTAKDLLTLNFKRLIDRMKTLSSNKDPWDVYDYLKKTIEENKLHSIFFFLLGDYSAHDKNIKYDHPLMNKLIKKIASFSAIGIHPSYKSSLQPKKIALEKKRLENMVEKPITKSRQHFLKFKLPDTYLELSKAGITEDYSMGFADLPGFRAGTCTPFYFYDLKHEKQTALKIFPVTCMEGTFIHYLKYTPKESLEVIKRLLNEVKKVGGTFINIWHNHTVSETKEFKEWRDIHDHVLEISALP